MRGGRARGAGDARCGERAAWHSGEPGRLVPGAAAGCRRGFRLLPSLPAASGIFMVIGAVLVVKGPGLPGPGVTAAAVMPQGVGLRPQSWVTGSTR